MAKDDLRRQGGGGGQKSLVLRRYSLWTAPNVTKFLKRLEVGKRLSEGFVSKQRFNSYYVGGHF